MAPKPLKLLIANHRWWFPTVVNGADIANHEFARRLRRNDVEVRVFGMVAPNVDGTTRQRNYFTDGIHVSLVQSDYIKRLSMIIEEFEPDLVITSSPESSSGVDDVHRMMNVFDHYHIPVLLYVHEIEPIMSLFDDVKHNLAAVMTNSSFMATKIKERWHIDATVIYPVPSSRTFKMSDTAGHFITFFNPLPHKGSDIVLSLVEGKFKDRAFLFVEGFMDPGNHGISLIRSGNVVHAKRSPDVATIYAMTKTLIIPSQWEEPFGRIALEAMYNKIPVIASNTGGLTESVGDGGLLIDDFTNVNAWAEAILEMDIPEKREKMIATGTQHMEKFSLEQQYSQFMDVFNTVLKNSSLKSHNLRKDT